MPKKSTGASGRRSGGDKSVMFQGIRVKMTPMMEQYIAAKEAHPDAVLFFRMGDFYEVFFDDARLVHRELGLTLTSRNKGDVDEVPMAGMPHRASEDYITTLVDAGYRVAVCDQLEDPAHATGIVKRGITRVVTPGTLIDTRPGEESKQRLLAAVAAVPRRGGGIEEELGLAVIDVSTGAFSVTELAGTAALSTELRRLGVRELLVGTQHASYIRPAVERINGLHVQVLDGDAFDEKTVIRRVADGPRSMGDWAENAVFLGSERVRDFFDLVRGFGFRVPRAPLSAVAAVTWYVTDVQRGVAGHIEVLRPYRVEDYMILDEATQANLELVETMRGARREGSLLGVMDDTVTTAGSRRLRSWLIYPLLDKLLIEERLEAIAELVSGFSLREDIRDLLDQTHDIERLSGRLATGRATPRDVALLRNTLDTVPEVVSALAAVNASLLRRVRKLLDPCDDVRELIGRAIVDEPPLTLQDGGVIREGFDAELDRVVGLARSGKDWLLAYEATQRKEVGITSLKVKYSKVFGYFLEVTKANLHLVPEHYVRRQTLANCERYYTAELKEYEEEVLSAEHRRYTLEQELFESVRGQVTAQLGRLRETAWQLADLDVLSSLAHIAHARDYCRPTIREDDVITIDSGRHPVVERFMEGERFVPNDLALNGTDARVQIITGPNMAGKSTVIRQAALISLLAQSGSFVPAKRADLGLVDRIFSRVGASDNLAQGQSTFMVEMTEAANILQHATRHSLIILDEIGRGTSTYDGLAIAWAVAEHLHDEIGARVLFATHYHELTELSRLRDGVVNYAVAVKEWQEEIIFLRKLVPGAANRSYGIQVARLAGVPRTVIERAKEILYNLEMNATDARGRPTFAVHLDDADVDEDAAGGARDPRHQLALFAASAKASPREADVKTKKEGTVLKDLVDQQLDTTTPLQALNLLYKWQRRLHGR